MCKSGNYIYGRCFNRWFNLGLPRRIMKAKILKTILKPISQRNISELLDLIDFYRNATPQEFKYSQRLDYHLSKIGL